MKHGIGIIISILLAVTFFGCVNRKKAVETADSFSGSESCIECHERFYELWATSYHGKAMMPVDARFMAKEGVPPSGEFSLEGKTYQVMWKDSSMVMVEKSGGGTKNYDIAWSLGGKNVFCFLTPMDKGRLQTIPLAYDVNRKAWFNYPESAVRHFVEDIDDEPLPWKDRMYTFNTGCYNCHVSQLSTNFDLATETYHTTWREAGINCETCHGPSAEHVRVCREAKEGEVPEDLKIISTKVFTPEQHNASCAPCHARMYPVTASYMPGDRFYDNYGVATFEDPDFYPDGRDLGETYTQTGWMMNKCKDAGGLHCVSCHTSSGRTRYMGGQSNQQCMPCHQENVENVAAHSRHPEGSPGAVCVNCHVPKREFVGHFIRSDHSFRPPMPEATIRFGSPNACNMCHQDKTPEWANQIVKKRENKNYQEKTLYWAQLIKEAREENWANIDKIFQVIKTDKYGEVVTNSLVRILTNFPEESKWDVLLTALENSSPLVRASAATGLAGNISDSVRTALLRAASDEYRLVRVSSALSLAAFPPESFSVMGKEILSKATEEYKQSLLARPDDWSAHYNMGIFYQNRGEITQALESYETSARLYPEAIMPLVNSSVLYSYLGNPSKAEENLRLAASHAPESEAANLNLGLLLAENGEIPEAKEALAKVLDINPGQAVAAYNLSVISSETDLEEAVSYAKMAAKAAPEEPKYAYTLAFFQNQAGQEDEAISTLKKVIEEFPSHGNSVFLLADIYIQAGNPDKAKKVYEDALSREGIPENEKLQISRMLSQLEGQ